MTEIEIEGTFGGIKGKFKLKGDYPVKLNPCEHLVDKNKLDGQISYITFHGDQDGNPHISSNTALSTTRLDNYR